jgi:hypothetical protein
MRDEMTYETAEAVERWLQNKGKPARLGGPAYSGKA